MDQVWEGGWLTQTLGQCDFHLAHAEVVLINMNQLSDAKES